MQATGIGGSRYQPGMQFVAVVSIQKKKPLLDGVIKRGIIA